MLHKKVYLSGQNRKKNLSDTKDKDYFHTGKDYQGMFFRPVKI